MYQATDVRAHLGRTGAGAPAIPIQFILLLAVAVSAMLACFVTGVDLTTIAPG